MSNFSNSSNTTELDKPEERSLTLMILLVTGGNFIVCVMIVVNNTLMLVTLAKTRKLWTLTNAYIASLSAADLLVGVVLTVRHFWLLPQTELVFDRYEYVCMPIICLLYVSALESQACLVLVSLDRYLYIVHPFWYERNVTAKVTKILIASSWVICIIFGFLPLKLNNFTPDTGCDPMTIISKYYLLYALTSYFVIAATTITIMYGRVFCVGNQHRRKIEATATAKANQGKEKSRWQVIKFLLLVCGLFYLCWLPLVFTVMVYFTVGAPTAVISITVSISALNSSVNIYVFMTMNKTFKQALTNIICCCKKGDYGRAVSPWTTSYANGHSGVQ